MPNPSTMAMEEEDTLREVQTVENPMVVVERIFDEKMIMVNRINELEQINSDLSGALSHLGKQRLEAYERGDRLLRSNCDMTQVTRDLASIARASRRFKSAVDTFFDDDCPSDAQTQEVATADCELEQLLDTHAKLYTRD